MFKRRDDFQMNMDTEVNYAAVDQMAVAQGIDPDVVRAAALKSYIGHVESAAKEAVKENDQKWQRCAVDTDGEWPRFEVRFQGDGSRAAAAFEAWGQKVSPLGGTGRILTASLRGSDGTNLQYMDGDYQAELMATFDALPQESQDMIDRLMDPNQP